MSFVARLIHWLCPLREASSMSTSEITLVITAQEVGQDATQPIQAEVVDKHDSATDIAHTESVKQWSLSEHGDFKMITGDQ